jgi:surfactin synthase thioesterase subunit
LASPTERWFQVWKPVPRPRVRLVCFPHAGGSATLYRRWPDSLPRDVEVWAAQLPGRGARTSEPPIVRMSALLEHFVSAIDPLFDRPVEFFGHSMGAVAAFELARLLRRLGSPLPRRIILSGRQAPHVPDRNPTLHRLPQDELVDRLRRMGGTSDAIFNEPELVALLLPAIRADLEAVETWVFPAEPPLTTPIVVAGGEDDARATPVDLEEWRRYSSGGFEVHRFAGGHFYLHERADLLGLLDRLLTH